MVRNYEFSFNTALFRREISYHTRLLANFAPIFYLNRKHILLIKQKQKKFADFMKNFVDFDNLLEIELLLFLFSILLLKQKSVIKKKNSDFVINENKVLIFNHRD